MEQVLKNEIIPPLLFFIAFSIVFTFLELLLIFALNRLGQKYWEFVIDVLIRAKVHHGKIIRCAVIVVLGVVGLGVILFSPLLEILLTASREMRLFALMLALVMALFYSINIRKTATLEVEKAIYRFIFFIVSLFIYVVVLVVAVKSYGGYVRLVNDAFINPASIRVGQALDQREKENLLGQFRSMNEQGLCVTTDYTDSKEVGLKNFVWVEDEPALAFGGATPDSKNPKGYLKGRACSNGKDTFLLTEWGSWYWVIQ